MEDQRSEDAMAGWRRSKTKRTPSPELVVAGFKREGSIGRSSCKEYLLTLSSHQLRGEKTKTTNGTGFVQEGNIINDRLQKDFSTYVIQFFSEGNLICCEPLRLQVHVRMQLLEFIFCSIVNSMMHSV